MNWWMRGALGRCGNQAGGARRSSVEGEANGKGFQAVFGHDFFGTFAPTLVASWFRFLGILACALGLDLCHFDAEQAFVQSSLEEDVFMRLSQGCR